MKTQTLVLAVAAMAFAAGYFARSKSSNDIDPIHKQLRQVQEKSQSTRTEIGKFSPVDEASKERKAGSSGIEPEPEPEPESESESESESNLELEFFVPYELASGCEVTLIGARRANMPYMTLSGGQRAEHLILDFVLRNPDVRRVVDPAFGGFRVFDDVGNSVKSHPYIDANVINSDMAPEEERSSYEVYELPLPKTEWLEVRCILGTYRIELADIVNEVVDK